MAIEKLGPYQITKTLGRGGMGTVYAGRHEESSDLVAVKVLATNLADDPRFRARFSAEIETLKKLKHPNIVRLLGYGEDTGSLFYSMELVEGSNLQEELRKGRPFSWREVTRIGVQICHALKHAHDNGVIHRDLKPANVLYDETEQSIKLTDFGIAKLWGGTHLTSVGGVVGTADYMSPEQADGKPVAARSDLYSLGAVMFALMTGRPPFVGANPADVIHSLRYSEPPSIRALRPDTPAGFDAIIMQLLSKDPGDRVATARVLANQLRAMEYALSVETQVADLPAHDSGQTSNDSVGHTSNLDASLSEEYFGQRGLSPDDSTVVPGVQASAAAHSASTTRFTTVVGADNHLDVPETATAEVDSTWTQILAGGALVLLIGGAVFWGWSMLQTPDADTLYSSIVTTAESGDRSQLLSIKPSIETFLEKYGDDPRAKDVQVIQRDQTSQSLYRQIDRRVERSGGVDYISPLAEQAFYVAMQNKQFRPTLARQQFQQLIDVFDQEQSDQRTTACVECARHELMRIDSMEPVEEKGLAADLRDKLRHAEETLSQAELRVWRQGVIALFGDKPWAKSVVAECQDALAQAP